MIQLAAEIAVYFLIAANAAAFVDMLESMINPRPRRQRRANKRQS